MGIDIAKLSNVREYSDGKITARCPACAAEGGDNQGNNMVVFRDGRFGCVKYEKDEPHRKKIYALAGSGGDFVAQPLNIEVKRYTPPLPRVLMDLSHYPLFSKNTVRNWDPEKHCPVSRMQEERKAEPSREEKKREKDCFEERFPGKPRLQQIMRNLEANSTRCESYRTPPPATGVPPQLPPNPMRGRTG